MGYYCSEMENLIHYVFFPLHYISLILGNLFKIYKMEILIIIIAHILVTALIELLIMKLLNYLWNIPYKVGFVIFVVGMMLHWFLFNGCCLNFVVDKPLAAYLGIDYMQNHNFEDTVAYEIIVWIEEYINAIIILIKYYN